MYTESMEKYLSVKEIAEGLGVNVLTIRRYIQAGKLEAIKLSKEYRIKQEDFDKFIRERQKKAKE